MKKKMPVWAKGVIILVILALMGAGIWAVYNVEPEKEETPSATDVPQYNVYRQESENVASIKVVTQNGTISLENSENGWILNDIAQTEVSKDRIEDLVTTVVTVISNYEIEKNPQDLSVYGLDNPLVRIEVVDKSGKIDKFIVGSQSPVTGEYFFMQEGGDTVYSIYEAKVTQLLKDEKYYQDFSRFSITMEELDEIIMQRKKNTIHLQVKDDLESMTSAYNIWEITKPYDGTFNAIDQFIDDKIISSINSLDIRTVAEPREDYGLDNPEYVLTINMIKRNEDKSAGEKYSQKLIISKNFESKRFVKIDGRDTVYEINSSDVEFMEVDEFLIISKLAILKDIAKTSKVEVNDGNSKTVMEIGHVENNKFTFKINGEEADEEESKKKYQEIISVSADALYNGEPLLGEAEITVDFYGYDGGADMKVEFIPIDDLSYAIRRDGVIVFTVKKADVKEMAEKIK